MSNRRLPEPWTPGDSAELVFVLRYARAAMLAGFSPAPQHPHGHSKARTLDMVRGAMELLDERARPAREAARQRAEAEHQAWLASQPSAE